MPGATSFPMSLRSEGMEVSTQKITSTLISSLPSTVDLTDESLAPLNPTTPSTPPAARRSSTSPQRSPAHRLGRKLPPALTESLELLSLSTPRSSLSASSTSSNCCPLEPSSPEGHITYHLEVGPPLDLGPIYHVNNGNEAHKMPYKILSYRRASPSVSASVSGSESSSLGCSSGSASTCGTWSTLEEIESAERLDRLSRPKETRKEKKERKRREADEFSPDEPPSLKALFEASMLEVLDEQGASWRFGDLVRDRRTIVIFIRHWFCPLCAQYINSILAEVSPSALEEANVDLIIIGNGSHKMLNGYRNKHFRSPYRMYTDPSLALYRALGLTRQTGNSGPDDEAGSYLVQSAMESTRQTLKRATQMPLLHSPGHFLQIGAEFVFDSPLRVSFTHRMTTTRDHAPIADVCRAAGVELEFIHYEPGSPPPPVHARSLEDVNDMAGGWMGDAQRERDSIRARKAVRRGLVVIGEDFDEAALERGGLELVM